MCSSEFDRTRNKTAKRRCREKSWRFRSNSSHPPSHTFWLMNVELRMKNCLDSCLSLLQWFYSLLPRDCYTDSTPRACVFGTLSPICSSNRLAKQRAAVDSAKAHTKKITTVEKNNRRLQSSLKCCCLDLSIFCWLFVLRSFVLSEWLAQPAHNTRGYIDWVSRSSDMSELSKRLVVEWIEWNDDDIS